MRSQIRKLAKATRQELAPFIKKHKFRDDWECSCLVCSWLLTKVLRAHGYDAQLVSGWFFNFEHAFVMVGDLVVDITATQFGLSPVWIQKQSKSHYRIEYNDYWTRREMSIWPKAQRPKTYKRELEAIYRRLR